MDLTISGVYLFYLSGRGTRRMTATLSRRG